MIFRLVGKSVLKSKEGMLDMEPSFTADSGNGFDGLGDILFVCSYR
jgi:hypothetical protein